MNILAYQIGCGLGDNLEIRMMLDTVKHNFQQIRISHSKRILNEYRVGDARYHMFLDELGTLLFSDHPYIFDHGDHPMITGEAIINLGASIRKPSLGHLLCKGAPLILNEPYIVITTHIRGMSSSFFDTFASEFFLMLQKLSYKYKIIVMGEKYIEPGKEYVNPAVLVFSIYDRIMKNIDLGRVIDLTVFGSGITAPSLTKIQQDCLVMRDAKAVITFGIGGNVWLSMATTNNIVGFRNGSEDGHDNVSNQLLGDVFVVNDFASFINRLSSY